MVAGGYYNGIGTMFLPLSGGASWRWLSFLPAERKWGPALGAVDGVLNVAGGKNYGDNTVDEMAMATADGTLWATSPTKRMRHKREFSAHATVPTEWFPECGF